MAGAKAVTKEELRVNLSEVLARVAYGSEQVVVTRHDKPFAAIVIRSGKRTSPKAGRFALP